MIILGLKISMQQLRYSSYLKSAQENADDNKYIEALVYCAMASHIKPKQEDPYLKIADYYMKRSESNQAYAVLNIGITKAKKQEELYAKQEEIQSFADEDVLEKEIMIPEYVETEGIRRKKDVKNLIQELKEYYGTDDNEYGEIAKYYKGYYYFVEENTIFRTDRDETTKEEVYRLDWLKKISSLKIVNDKTHYLIKLNENKINEVEELKFLLKEGLNLSSFEAVVDNKSKKVEQYVVLDEKENVVINVNYLKFDILDKFDEKIFANFDK